MTRPPVTPGEPPRLRLLTAPALLVPRALPFAPQRRWRLAALLALSPQGMTRDELAALFWPDRPQAAARSNTRKLVFELRRLDLPGMELDGERLRWSIVSDASMLLDGRVDPGVDASHALPGLDGGDSPAWDDWLRSTRQRLRDAWRDALLAPSAPVQALASARRLLAHDPEDEDARRAADAALQALGRGALRPVAAPPLVGRGTDLRQLMALLDEPGCRVLTLFGPGGIGKSAMALAVLRAHPGPVHWVALEDLSDAAAVPVRIARELGVNLGPNDVPGAALEATLAARPCVLVLDNAEHLVQPVAALLTRLLDAAPALRCLVTSRMPLRVAPEWLLPVEPLAAPAARELFMRAAAEALPGFEVGAAGDDLDDLLARLAGVPLAIRLAASWLRHLSLPALSREARRSLAVLAQPASPDERPAHASLDETFALSWRLLPPPLQTVLAALTVALSPLPLALACEAVAATPAQIVALAEASLVDLLPDGRVTLHPLVRDAAHAHLGTADAARACDRLSIALVDAARPWTGMLAFGSDRAITALDPLQPLLHQAWRHALAQGQAGWLTVLAPALSQLHQHHGGIGMVIDDFAAAEQHPAVRADVAARGAVALEHAALRYWRGEYDRAERSARIAVIAARARRHASDMSDALNTLAQVHMRQGRVEEADARLTRALAAAQDAHDDARVAIYAGNLSAIRRLRGQGASAQALARKALAGYRAEGNVDGEVGMLNELGLLAHQDGRYDEAFEHYAQALGVLQRDPASARRPPMLTHQASVRLDQGRADEALVLAEASWALLRGMDMTGHEPPLRRVLAETLIALDRAEEAAAHLRRARELTARQPASAAHRGVIWSCAVYALARGQHPLAAELAAHAMTGSAPTLPRYASLAARLKVSEGRPLPDPAAALQALLD